MLEKGAVAEVNRGVMGRASLLHKGASRQGSDKAKCNLRGRRGSEVDGKILWR